MFSHTLGREARRGALLPRGEAILPRGESKYCVCEGMWV